MNKVKAKYLWLIASGLAGAAAIFAVSRGWISQEWADAGLGVLATVSGITIRTAAGSKGYKTNLAAVGVGVALASPAFGVDDTTAQQIATAIAGLGGASLIHGMEKAKGKQ